ncbi:MAG: ABC transporter substrate-binding protein [Treponema sp.]|jgi:peptide/nickel transport system substrate-binding protein|nr:ABC transporter substrate-binding protein [Treponema sp.]
MIKQKAALLLAIALAVLGAPRALCRGTREGEKPPAQELVIGEQFDLGSIDPLQGMLDDTQILVYNGLVEIDADFKQTPGLAERWEMSADGRTWTFSLRRGVRFHDGTPWNAQAARFNLEGRLAGYPGTGNVERYETPDDYTLIFHLSKPTASLTSDLSRTMMSMVSPGAINSDGSLKAAVGTGPYKLASWRPDVEYVFEANNDFWGGAPNLQRITFKVITDAQARALALETGEIDMMSGYQSLGAIKRLQHNRDFNIIMKTQNTSGALFYNLQRPPLDSLAVRKAIGLSIDFNTLIGSLLPGLASPPRGFFSPAYGDLNNPEITMNTYNPGAAKALLEEDGWVPGPDGIRRKGGTRLSFSLTYRANNSEDALIAPAIKDYLGAAGMDLVLNAVEGGAFGDIEDAKDYDVILSGQSFIPTDDTAFNYASGYWHSGSYYKIYTSPELDALIDTLQITMDRAKRVELNRQIQRLIMDNCPTQIVYHRNSIRLARANITNFNISSGCWHINRLLKDTVIGRPR